MADLADTPHRLVSRSLPGCSAFLRLDGQAAEVHGDCDMGGKTHAYVEAKDGARVEVGFVDHRKASRPPEDAFVLRLTVDGVYVNGATFPLKDPLFSLAGNDPKRITVFSGQLSDDRTLRRLELQQVEYTDKQDDATAPSGTQEVGKIKLAYHRISNLGWVDPAFPEQLDTGIVLEKKPDLENETPTPAHRPTHHIQLGDAIAQPLRPWLAYDYLDDEDEPFCVFEWRYYARKTLQDWTFLPPDPRTPSRSASALAATYADLERVRANYARLSSEVDELSSAVEGTDDDIVSVEEVSASGWSGGGKGKGKGKGEGQERAGLGKGKTTFPTVAEDEEIVLESD
ncbi:hypothetical protein JCM10213_002402 [Rhodosporidiobolus nylandii]